MTIHEQIERAKQALGKVQNEHSLTAAKEAESALLSLLLSEESSFMLRLQLDAAADALVEAQTENDMQQCYIDSLAPEVHKMREHAKQFAEKYAIESDTSYYETVERTVRGLEESLRRMESRVEVLQQDLRAAEKEVELQTKAKQYIHEATSNIVRQRDEAERKVADLQAKCDSLNRQRAKTVSAGELLWKECKYFVDLPQLDEPVVVALHNRKRSNGLPAFCHAKLVAKSPTSLGFDWILESGIKEPLNPSDIWCPSRWIREWNS